MSPRILHSRWRRNVSSEEIVAQQKSHENAWSRASQKEVHRPFADQTATTDVRLSTIIWWSAATAQSASATIVLLYVGFGGRRSK